MGNKTRIPVTKQKGCNNGYNNREKRYYSLFDRISPPYIRESEPEILLQNNYYFKICNTNKSVRR